MNRYRYIFALMLVASSTIAYGFLGLATSSWEEEVVLHNGSKIVLKRSQSYGGRHEIGQRSPIKEHVISFKVPNTRKTIEWVSEYSEDAGRTNFNLLALHVLDGVPYVVAEPNLCYSYEKWGRPNLPYVVFKNENGNWKRIPLAELPVEFTTTNVAVDMPWDMREGKVKFDRSSFLSAESIRSRNQRSRLPERVSIVRETMPLVSVGLTSCPVSSDAAGKFIAPEIDGKVLYFNWWPLAKDWLKNRCSGCDHSAFK